MKTDLVRLKKAIPSPAVRATDQEVYSQVATLYPLGGPPPLAGDTGKVEWTLQCAIEERDALLAELQAYPASYGVEWARLLEKAKREQDIPAMPDFHELHSLPKPNISERLKLRQYAETGVKWGQAVGDALACADLVIWRHAMWELAQRGAREAILGQPIPESFVDGLNEFWSFDSDYIPHQQTVTQRELVPGTTVRGWLLVRQRVTTASGFPPEICRDEGSRPRIHLYVMYGFSADMVAYLSPLIGGDAAAFYMRYGGSLAVGEPITEGFLQVASLLHFMRLPVIETRPAPPPPRGERRRYEKTYGKSYPAIRTILLRHADYSHTGGEQIEDTEVHNAKSEERKRGKWEYSVRFFVRGHWRKNPKNPTEPIWVRPHLKGKGKEKLPTSTIYDVAR